MANLAPLLPHLILNWKNFDFINYLFSISRYSDCSQIKLRTYITSLLISPWFETVIFYVTYKFTYRIHKFPLVVTIVTYMFVFIISYVLHGGALSNIGQAINFCIMWKIYRTVAKSPTELGPYVTVSLVHLVLNSLAMLDIFIFDTFIAPGFTAPAAC